MIYSKGITHNTQSRKPRDFNFEMIDSAMKAMSELLNRLSLQIEQLPEVKNDGHTKDPSVENLYAEKEESIKKAAGKLNTLRDHGEQIDQHIAACRRNIDQIREDSESLNLKQAKEKYTFAELSLGFNIKKSTQRRKELSDMISWGEKVLNIARSKKFAGKVPKKQFIPPPEIMASLAGLKTFRPPGQNPAASLAPGPSFNTEFNSLMALGPIGSSLSGNGPSITGA